jgi:hypothetical protein
LRVVKLKLLSLNLFGTEVNIFKTFIQYKRISVQTSEHP